MKKNKNTESELLRQQAEALLKKNARKTSATLSEIDMLSLIHELEVHQIELELQNDELQRAKELADLATDKYSDLYDFAPSGYLTLSPKGDIVELNLTSEKMLGQERSKLSNCKFALFVSSDTRSIFNLFLDKIFQNNNLESCEVALPNDGDLPTYVLLTGTLTEKEELCNVTMVDITERKQAEDALSKSEGQKRAIADYTYDWESWFAPEGGLLWVNPAVEKLTGFSITECEEMTNYPLPIVYEDDQRAFGEHLQLGIAEKNSISNFEFRISHKDGSVRWMAASWQPIFDDQKEHLGQRISMREITESKQAEQERIALEAQLHQSQKIEAIGTMVGGISHEFNNVLQSMFLYAGLVQSDLPENEILRSNFQRILDGGNRARDLIKQVLTFSRKTDVEMKPRYLHELVQELLLLERASLPANIDIQQGIDLKCGLVLCDKTQIHQIIMNLCNNAQHAMADHGGTLTVSLKPTRASLNKNAPETDVLELTVSDTGHGIEASVLEKIFDPFFTTKELGQGTGLGLSVIHGIVEMMEGHISVTSEIGKGTTFLILFPTTTIAAERNMVNSPIEVARASRCVLLVDDEESIRSVTQIILTRKGFKVDSASDGKQALELFKANPNKYDLIVTDQSMPEMSGIELTKAIRDSKTDIPIILSTGQLGIEDEIEFKDIGITGFIQKPWTAEELIEKIRELDDN